jgi:hypothetical protein
LDRAAKSRTGPRGPPSPACRFAGTGFASTRQAQAGYEQITPFADHLTMIDQISEDIARLKTRR